MLAWFALAYATRADAGNWLHWAGLYVAACAAVSCLPSLADWRIVLSRPLGLLLYAALAVATYYLLTLR